MTNLRFAALGVLALSAAAMAPPALAVEIASSHFDTGAEGWRNGDFTVSNATSAVTYDAAGFITVTDLFPYNAFLAPGAFLGDRRAANRGVLSFDLGSALNDGVGAPVPLVTLIGAGKLVFGGLISTPPSTGGFTHYDIALKADSFFLGNPGDPNPSLVSEADFAAILADLDQLSISGDFHSGEDFVRLDNVVLTAGSVPEPGAWALMIGGFGLAGATLRRRRSAAA